MMVQTCLVLLNQARKRYELPDVINDYLTGIYSIIPPASGNIQER